MAPNRNYVEFSIEGGLHYHGAIPGRDHDALGLGIAYIRISDQVADAVSATNQRDRTSYSRPDFEATIELVYRYQVAPWFSIQPHAQYVIQPGGTNDNDNALIVGVRTNRAFQPSAQSPFGCNSSNSPISRRYSKTRPASFSSSVLSAKPTRTMT